jgi:hypothetical protein
MANDNDPTKSPLSSKLAALAPVRPIRDIIHPTLSLDTMLQAQEAK